MNRTAFYAALRRRDSGVFGTSLSQGQVDGTERIINEAVKRGTLRNHLAYALSTTYHETGHSMQPVIETRQLSERKNPSVDTAIARLESSWKRGRMPWVRSAYWRKDSAGKSWLGRGLAQITHKVNYEKMSEALGVDLVADPDKALDPEIAVQILFEGMELGSFTGKGFNDFIDELDESDALDRAEYKAARKIINGTDKADLIAGYAVAFERALVAAGYPLKPDPLEAPRETLEPAPKVSAPKPATIERQPVESGNWLASVFAAILSAMKGRKA